MAIAVLPANTPAIMSKMMLERAETEKRLGSAFTSRKIDKNSGSTIILSRWINAAIAVVPEPEGQNPTTIAPTLEQFTGTMQRYSVAFATSRLAADMSPLDWIKGMTGLLDTNVSGIRERIRINAARSGTNVMYNSPAISSITNVNGVITLGRIQKATTSIRAAKGKTFSNEASGSTKVGTNPVEAGFYCFFSSNAIPDVRNLPGFIPKARMAPSNYPEGTFGSVDDVIFVSSAEMLPAAGAATNVTNAALLSTGGFPDVYDFIVCARDGLVDISLGGSGKDGYGNVETFMLDKADKSDTTNSRVVVSAAWYDLAMLVSFDWVVNIKCAVTANPA